MNLPERFRRIGVMAGERAFRDSRDMKLQDPTKELRLAPDFSLFLMQIPRALVRCWLYCRLGAGPIVRSVISDTGMALRKRLGSFLYPRNDLTCDRQRRRFARVIAT